MRRKNLVMASIDYKKAYDIVLQSWIIDCHKLYKISDEFIRFTEKTMKNWRVELTAGGKGLAEVKIQKISSREMPHNHKLRKWTGRYKLTKSQEKINHLMYMDDIKLFPKTEKELETIIQTVRIYIQDIGMEFGIEKCAMLLMRSEKS